MFVFSAHTQSGAPHGLRQVALDLFPSIARLTTWINQAGDDDRRVRELETDQARGLANEVRLFARRAHVMLAQPVWPRFRDLVDNCCFSPARRQCARPSPAPPPASALIWIHPALPAPTSPISVGRIFVPPMSASSIFRTPSRRCTTSSASRSPPAPSSCSSRGKAQRFRSTSRSTSPRTAAATT